MRLRKFRVRAYRCIHDSGEITVGDLAAFVGRNESGKTTILQALTLLNRTESVSDLDLCDEMDEELKSEMNIVEGEFELTKKDSKKPKPALKKTIVKKNVPDKKTKETPKVKKSKKVDEKIEPEPEEEKIQTLEEQIEKDMSEDEIKNLEIEKANMEKVTYRVCELLATFASNTMHQNEIWKKMRISNRDGARLALRLERRGIISREKILDKGRWTYNLTLIKSPISTESIINAPCLTCNVEQKCTLEGEVSPRTCQLINDWVLIKTTRSKSKK